MKFVRFYLPKIGARLGLWDNDMVYDLTSSKHLSCSSFLELFDYARASGKSVDEFVSESFDISKMETYEYRMLDRKPSNDYPHLLIPIVPKEVWACGVTYIRSRVAREYETSAKGIYDRVYDAPRPEIFFKATAERCVGPNEAVNIRSDSDWTVPEAELAFIVGGRNEIVAYTIGNDVSARDIEGENPLYLPQAKIYMGGCSLGPAVVTSETLGDPMNLDISCKVVRDGGTVFEGKSSTSRMKRGLDELLYYLKRSNPLPSSTTCLTGTGIVPPDDFTLKPGDIVDITVEKIGTLRNPVARLKEDL